MKALQFYFGLSIFFLSICIINVEAETLTLTLHANNYQIQSVKDNYSTIEMTDYGATGMPGAPQLPAKTFMIAVPPGAQVTHVQVTADGQLPLAGKFHIKPSQPIIQGESNDLGAQIESYQKAQAEWQNNYDQIYAADSAYPAKPFQYQGQGQWRKYTYVRVRVFPFQYFPQSRRLIHSPAFRVTIDYTLPIRESKEWQRIQRTLFDHALDDLISSHIVNFQDVQKWYRPAMRKPKDRTLSGFVDYLMIVRDDAMQNALASFVAWKEKTGLSVKVVTLESIFHQMQGKDKAEKIWRFLHANYEEWGLRYVLLVGNVDVLPIRFLFPSDKAWAYPSDFYYAKLTGQWDVDGDNRFGEFQDDHFDPAPDVIVGRIPHNDPAVVAQICNQIISFEQDLGAWKRNALLATGIMDYKASGKTDCAELAEYLKKNVLDVRGWTYTTEYEKGGLDPSPYASDYPLSLANFENELGPQRQSVINSVAHGNTGIMVGKVWAKDIDKDNVCDYSTDKTKNEATSDLFNHINHIPTNLLSTVFLCGCSTGVPADAGKTKINSSWQIVSNPMRNLGRAYLLHGAPAVIASTAGSDYRQNWKKPQDASQQSLNFYFFDHLINKDERFGDAFFDAMLQYATNHTLQRGIRVYTLYGDPSLNIKGYDINPRGTDVVIQDSTTWGFAADNDDNGDMYVAAITTDNNHPGNITVYKSTDHGSHWTLWNSINSRNPIFAVDVIVAKWANGASTDHRVLVFYTTSGGGVYVARFPISGSTGQAVLIASEGGMVSMQKIVAARDPIQGSFNIYLAYETFDQISGDFKIKTARSLDNGVNWRDQDSFPNSLSPSISAAPGGNVFLVMNSVILPYDVILARSTDWGENWGYSKNLTSSLNADGYGAPVVAASTDAGTPTVWVAFPFFDNNRYDLYYTFSKNKGVDWDAGRALVPNVGINAAVDMKGYHASPNRWMNVAYTASNDKPTVFWRYSNGSSPDNWSSTRIVNDFEAVAFQSMPAKVVYSPGAAVSGSGVVYQGENTLYFSAPWLSGQQFTYNKGNSNLQDFSAKSQDNKVVFYFNLQEREHITLVIHDAMGRLVRTLVSDELSAGNHELTWDGTSNAGHQAVTGSYVVTCKTFAVSISRKITYRAAVKNARVDNADWIDTDDLPGAFLVSSLLPVNENEIFAAAAASIDVTKNEGVVYFSPDKGEAWMRTAALEGCWSVSSLLRTDNETLLAGGLISLDDQVRGVVYRSDNRGEQWVPVLSFPDGVVTCFTQDANGALYAATGWNGLVFKSDDDGRNWSPISELGENVNIYKILATSNGRLLIGLEKPDNIGEIYWSENGGEEWFPADGLQSVQAVYDVLESGDHLYAGVRGPNMGWVYRSDDGGTVWSQTTEFIDNRVQAVQCLLEGNDGKIIAGAEMAEGPSATKVFAKAENQDSWLQMGSEIDLANTVYALAKTSDTIFAGTGYIYGNVYKFNEEITGARKNQDTHLPTFFSLAQNYPNPFNPETTIQFDVKTPCQVVLTVYNLVGQEIVKLIDQHYQPGYYQIKFNASGLSSGIFWYRIVMGDYEAVHKMVVLQ